MPEGGRRARVAAVKFRFAFAQPAARGAYGAHLPGDLDLPRVEFVFVERPGHEVIVRFHDFVEHHRRLHRPPQQAARLGQIHQSDARHHGRAVRERQPVADAEPEGRYAACRHRLGSRDGFAPERDLRLADQRQCDVRQLHQVAACAYAAVARHERVYFVVEEIGQYPHHVGVHARLGVEERLQPRQHRRPHADVGQRFARAAAVRTDDVVLEAVQVGVADPVLCHGAEPRVDAVDDLSLLEFLQETVTRLHFAQGFVVDLYCGLVENPVVYGI